MPPVRGKVEAPQKSTAKPSKSTTAKPTTNVEVEEGKASVSYTISITKNLGDYESLKIQAGITIPYGASDDLLKKLDDLLVVSREKVVGRLQKDISDITDNLS